MNWFPQQTCGVILDQVRTLYPLVLQNFGKSGKQMNDFFLIFAEITLFFFRETETKFSKTSLVFPFNLLSRNKH